MINIEKNTRDYTHKKRKGWDQTSRIDFTQTLKFVSARPYDSKEENTELFDLNDQISSFRVLVAAYSKSGRYGFKELAL